ncbi:MAG: hypothetical protein ABI851_13530 [Saprospiraceae bacterium]
MNAKIMASFQATVNSSQINLILVQKLVSLENLTTIYTQTV